MEPARIATGCPVGEVLREALGQFKKRCGIGSRQPQRREITTKSLADYVIRCVEELANAENASQEPQYFKGRDAEDFNLARW